MRFSAIADNPPRIFDHGKWTDWLSRRKGQRIEIELRDEAAIRSNRANRFWWGVVVPLVAEQWERERGNVPIPRSFVHDALVGAFGGSWVDTPLGRARRSSSDMTVQEFSEMIERTAEYLRDKYNVILPKPEEWSE